MTTQDRNRALVGGYSIQGSRVLDGHGNTWGDFKSHDAAKAAVDGYAAGFEFGKEIGRREAQLAVRQALGIDL